MFINAKLLKDAITALAPILSSRCSYPVLEYVLMEPDGAGMVLRATDREVSGLLRLPIECEFSVCVPGKFMAALLGAIGDETIEITYGDRLCKLFVNYWLGKATVNCIDAKDFPAYSDHFEWKELGPISSAQMAVIGNQVAFAADTKDLNVFRYVGFDGQQVYATDKFKLSFAVTADNKPMMFVPACGLPMAGRFFAESEAIHIFLNQAQNQLRFVSPTREMNFELGSAKPRDLSSYNPSSFAGQIVLPGADLLGAMAQLKSARKDSLLIEVQPFSTSMSCLGDSLHASVVFPVPSTSVFSATCSLTHLSQIIASFGENKTLTMAWNRQAGDTYFLYIFEGTGQVQCVLPVISKK